jgi:hypothetical protein
MKGRPITKVEFQAMLNAVASVVGDDAAESWKYALRGLWESALRINELMRVSWDKQRSYPATLAIRVTSNSGSTGHNAKEQFGRGDPVATRLRGTPAGNAARTSNRVGF